jgi:hypothetical protein
MSKQTVVDVIFDNFNLLSDAEFKSWMLNKYDELKAMEKEQIEDAFGDALNQHRHGCSNRSDYYKKTYGGEQCG